MLGCSFSHYRILDRLGQGGMGVVYLAEDTLLHRRVAIKFPITDSGPRLLEEARAASGLSHHAIAAVYDFGEFEGRPYVVMELVEGESLADVLRHGPLPPARAVEVVRQVLEALCEAHARQIVHRDIKPSNIRIGPRGAVKLVDFGLAKRLAGEAVLTTAPAAAGTATETAAGRIAGTPAYMAPEQARGEPADARTDLFSTGAVLYECLTGKSAFSGPSAIDVLVQVLQVEPPLPSKFNPEVSAELDRITARALAKNPGDRYQSAREMLLDLTAGGPATLSMKGFAVPRTGLRVPRRVALGVLALIAAGAVLLLWPRRVYRPGAEALRWYEEGVNAIRDGTYYKASKALERAVAVDGRYAPGHARLAEASSELDDFARAQEEMLRAAPPGGDQPRLAPAEAAVVEAVHHELTGDGNAALATWTRVLNLVPQSEKANVYLDLGRACEKVERPQDAVRNYREATLRSPQYAAAFLRLGVLDARGRDSAGAAVAFDKAEALYRASSNVEGLTEVLYQRGVAAAASGGIGEADRHFGQALEMARAAGSLHQQIAALFQMSRIDYLGGDTARAEAHATDAMELARRNGLELLTTRGLLYLGNAQFVRGDHARAAASFTQALEFARLRRARPTEARALFLLGSLRVQDARLPEGIRDMEQALAFFQRGGYRDETAKGLIVLGRARRDQGDYQGALRAFESQIELARKSGDAGQLAVAHEGIGSVLYVQERYPEAIAHFREAYEAGRARGDQLAQAYARLNAAWSAVGLGRFEEARQALNEVSAMVDRPGGYASLGASVEYCRGVIALAEMRFAVARQAATRLLSTPGRLDAREAMDVAGLLGLAEIRSGAGREGRRDCEAALDKARKSGIPRYIASAELMYAEALMESGEPARAREAARQVRETFARGGRHDSEAQAWLIEARAARAAGDMPAAREAAANASRAIETLQQPWSPEDRASYASRPDVRFRRAQLESLLKIPQKRT